MSKISYKVKNCQTSVEKVVTFDTEKLIKNGTTITDKNCPEGYIYNSKNKLCERIDSVEPTIKTKGLITVGTGDDFPTHGRDGMKLYQNLLPSQIPVIDFIDAEGNNQFTMADSYAPNEAYGTEGRMEVNQVENVGYEWRGFSKCLEVDEEKIYYLGIAANNFCRFKLNGSLIVSMTRYIETNFNYWHVFPIKLTEGINIIEMEGLDAGSGQGDGGAFACEIYDCSRSDLENVILNSDIEPYVIFGSAEMVGDVFHTGSVDTGYNCPEGYAINLCEDPKVCTLITRTEPEVSFKVLKLKESPTDCWEVLEEVDTDVSIQESNLSRRFETCESCIEKLNKKPEPCEIISDPICVIEDTGECDPFYEPSVLAQAFVTVQSRVVKPAYMDKFNNTIVGLAHTYPPGDIINKKYFVRKWVGFVPSGGHLLQIERLDGYRMTQFDLDQLKEKVKTKITGKVK